jgi:hypothetical protein
MDEWSFFAVNFNHFDGFCGAIAGAETAADAEVYVEDLSASKVFWNLTFDERVFAGCGFFE